MDATATTDRDPKNWKLLENRPITAGSMRVVSVANQKGGVAKTTTSVNLAAALALRGHRVLVVDVDPQGNASTGLGVERRRDRPSTYDVLVRGLPLAEARVATAIPSLWCVPASVDLAGAEIELVSALERERKLREALAPEAGSYDLVFLDCPPSLGLLTVNALAAAEDLIVPVQCEYYALEGLGQLLETAERVRRSLNPALRIAGMLLTMYDARTKLSSQVASEVRGHFGELVYRTVIPRSVRLSEAPSFGEPVVTLDPTARGSIAHRLLAAEVEARYGMSRTSPAPPRPPPVAEPREPSYGTTTTVPELDRAWPPPPPWAAA
ncbi:MAG: ParA family protein [Actinomycetota bacterium]